MNGNWSSNEQRPRERLLRLGPADLSDSELLAILVGSGTRAEPADAIAHHLLRFVQGSLVRLYRLHPSELRQLHGIGDARGAAILAGMELGRRMLLRNEEHGGIISRPHDAYACLRERIPVALHETIMAIYLDNRNHILACNEVAGRRLPAGCELDLRHLLKTCLAHNASGVILAHNHPSEDVAPSERDIQMSRELEGILLAIGVELVDHLVLARHGYAQVHWKEVSAENEKRA
jgi:DNA repair protein RadC